MKLNELTLSQAAEGLAAKQFSSRQLTQAVLDEIKKKDSQIGAYLTVVPEKALAQADNVDRLISQGENLPPTAGIPVAIKDVIATEGITTTAGSAILENFIPPYDATVIAKLKENHAVILGKTNCDEFAMGSSTENSAFKKTKNPHDLTRVPGGTSGGSTAAVAANMCLYSLGSDTGGSIRQPASLCGVVGLKPTYGRVSRYGLIATASSLEQIGPITRNCKDAAIVLNYLAGFDPADANSAKIAVSDYTKSLKKPIKGLKIGKPKEYFGPGLDGGVREVIETALKKLESQGAEIVDISIPHQKYALACYYIINPSEISANLARFDGIRYGRTRQYFGPEPKRRIMLGTHALSAGYHDQYYNKAVAVRNLIRQDFEKAFNSSTGPSTLSSGPKGSGRGVDLIGGPTSPTVAWKLGEKVDDPLKMYLSDIYTVTANLVGIPAISIPAGEVNGLPVGLQIAGPHFAEDLILQVAYNFERANG